MKYKNWIYEWIENYVKPTVKRRTFLLYSAIAEHHIIPSIGKYDLNELNAIIIQRHITYLLESGNLKTGKGLAPNSVNSVINVIQASLEAANKIGLCKEYAADKIKRPRIAEKQVMCFSVAEQKKIEQAVLYSKKEKMFGILLCLYTGLRIGELLALEWSDVDFNKGQLSITKTCYDGRGENGRICRMVDTPKTVFSNRTIPMPKQLLSYFDKIRRKSKNKYVIGNGEKDISIRSYQKTFSSLLKRLNLPHKGFHSLRHTFATRALECGMDVKTLSEILGHKSPTITLNRYAHSMMEHKKEMMNKLGNLL